MQTVLGLVIHRFDIHIKRETGCFDVRGSRSQGTAEVAHFFFYWHSTGWRGVSGVWWWWVGWVADCCGQGVQKDSGWGAVIPVSWLDAITPHFTYVRSLRIIHKLPSLSVCPCISPIFNSHPFLQSTSSHLLLLCFMFLYTILVLKSPYQKPTLQLSVPETPGTKWRDGCQSLAVSKIADGEVLTYHKADVDAVSLSSRVLLLTFTTSRDSFIIKADHYYTVIMV